MDKPSGVVVVFHKRSVQLKPQSRAKLIVVVGRGEGKNPAALILSGW
jgi:hypothetical protein